MKRLLAVALAILLMLPGCASMKQHLEPPEKETIQGDITRYIQSLVDPGATITDFFLEASNEEEDGSLAVTCVAVYESSVSRYIDQFTVRYTDEDGAWEQSTISINTDYDGRLQEEKLQNEEEAGNTEEASEISAEAENEKPAETTSAGTVSDELSDFMFYLEGTVYQLPLPYQVFKNLGWSIKETSYDPVYEDTEMSANSYTLATLTNGRVEIGVSFINLSGNVKQVKDCNIGEISIEARDNLDFYIAGGIDCMSTAEEITAQYGTPTQMSTYDDYSYYTYEFDSYVRARFSVYNTNTTYNTIELRNFVAGATDETEISDERPAYLDSYTAPSSLGTDPTKTRFQLDGVLYEIPCPITEFLNNGWEITYDSVGSLGGGNDAYGVTITKGDYDISLSVANFGKQQVAVKNCAVTEVEFNGYRFEDCPDTYLQFPNYLHINSTTADLDSLGTGLEKSENSAFSSVRYQYETDDYSTRIVYYFDLDDYDYRSITIRNENWSY